MRTHNCSTKNQNGAKLMSTNDRVLDVICFLFTRYWDEELTEEQEDDLYRQTSEAIHRYGWPKVYEASFKYLTEKCTTPESVVNFAHLYFEFDWYKKVIPSPHRFLAYFYFRVDCNPSKYDAIDIFDTLATSILPICGYQEADLMVDPRYTPELDPKIIAEIEEWKKSEGK